MRNAIFLTFDDAYARFALSCLRSIKENYPRHPELLIFYDGIDRAVLDFVDSLENSRHCTVESDFMNIEGVSLGRVGSPKVYFRYLLWTSYFDDYDTIVHLDVDSIVMQPFDELFATNDFFAVQDFTPTNSFLFKRQYFADPDLIGLLHENEFLRNPWEFDMLNAGVFAIPKKYRTPEQYQLLMKLTKTFHRYTDFADQAAISLWAYKNRIDFQASIEYNFQIPHMINSYVFFQLIVRQNFQLSAIRILHYTWWKPDSQYYKRFHEVCRAFLEIEDYAKKLTEG